MQTVAISQTGADRLSTLATRIQDVALLHRSCTFYPSLERSLEVATLQLTADIEAALDRLDPIIAEALS